MPLLACERDAVGLHSIVVDASAGARRGKAQSLSLVRMARSRILYYVHAARCTPDFLRIRNLGIQGFIVVKYRGENEWKGKGGSILNSTSRSRANT